jgi:hypothetical protein
MLQMLEGVAEKQHAQALMVSLLRKAWPRREKRLVAWRPASTELQIQHTADYWFGSREVFEGVHRHWNSFGIYKPEGNLGISVEMNIPIKEDKRNVSGFFAKVLGSRTIYLMHDGGLRGGKKGVGREAFLSATASRPIEVQSTSIPRFGLIVAPLKSRYFEAGISSYLEKVVAFKAAVRQGVPLTPVHGLPPGTRYSDYFKEFSGKKSGGGGERFSYESRHGDVVHELVNWVSSEGIAGKVKKSVFVDLAVVRAGKLVAVFEVKSSTDRQSLYTAVGQLMVHSAKAECVERYLVVPHGAIPDDVRSCLAALSIRVVRYEFKRRAIVFAS